MTKPSDKFEYFMDHTNKRLEKIDGKMDRLLAFKWKIVGGTILGGVVGSILLTAAINVAVVMLTNK